MQVCFLNGHLRKANAENVTLKNQNQIERDAYDKRAAQLQQAMDMHSKCTQEALKAQKAMDARARDTIATSAQHVAAATREQKQAEKMAYDLKVSVYRFISDSLFYQVSSPQLYRPQKIMNRPFTAAGEQKASRNTHSPAGSSTATAHGFEAAK